MNPPKYTEREKQRLKEQHTSWLWYIALSCLAGIALGVLITIGIIRFNIGNMGDLLANAAQPKMFIALLAGSLASLFGMVVMGIAIMVRADWERDNL